MKFITKGRNTGAPSSVAATHLTTETCADTRLPLLPSSGGEEKLHLSISPLQSETRTKGCETPGESPTLQTRYKRFKHCTSAISTPGAAPAPCRRALQGQAHGRLPNYRKWVPAFTKPMTFSSIRPPVRPRLHGDEWPCHHSSSPCRSLHGCNQE